MTMKKEASSLLEVLSALPKVQEAVRAEVAKRIAADEVICTVEGDIVFTQQSGGQDLQTKRKKLMAIHYADRVGKPRLERKSVA